MKPKSHTLFHFTSEMAILKHILKDGFWPRYCLEDVRWLSEDGIDYVAFPMVCFCDIPLSRIQEHVGFYGNFGVGMTKDWALRNGMNPILYVSGNNPLQKQLYSLNEHANKLNSTEAVMAAKTTMRFILAHCKPAEGNMIVGGKPAEKEFYQESEWRYVPISESIFPYLKSEKFEDTEKLESENQKAKEYCTIKITPQDIKYVFVKSDSDIPEIVNFIQTELDQFPSSDLKVLVSRVTSLESITNDL